VAQTVGARIAKVARRERGNTACGPNKVDGGGYGQSCLNHHARHAWCSDFAKWVWENAGYVLHTEKLNSESGSFGDYGPVRHNNPKVGDTVLFNFRRENGKGNADHVAIVVSVLPNGKIVSIGGNEGATTDTSRVTQDKPYSAAFGSSDPLAPNGPLSGYVSPVEDDMPYSQEKIKELVNTGVHRELNTASTRKDIVDLVKKGVRDELRAENLNGIARQLDELKALVLALPQAMTPAAPAGPDGAAQPAGPDGAAQPAQR
jgi:hypothetical protein